MSEESSKGEYREPRKSESTSSSESDDDEYGAALDYSKPTADKSKLDYIQQFFKQKFGFSHHDDADDVDSKRILKSLDFNGLVDHWNKHGFKKIVTMVGAGISTCKFQSAKFICANY